MSELPFAATTPISVARVGLKARNASALADYYSAVVGLEQLSRDGGTITLGAKERPLLVIENDPAASPDDPRAAGLFHTAFLMPDRTELARWLRHAAHNNVTLDGASDHLVSEAIYLSDPEGNGIEIYADRPHEAWNFRPDGTVEMDTRRLDLQALYDSAPTDAWEGMAPGSAIGHIHLQVGDIPQANAFYRDVLGLKMMADYPGASFFATGDYHHHLAANIWNSRGAQARSDGMSGLSDYTLHFNDAAALKAALANLDAHAIKATAENGVWSLKDPWGIGLRLTA